jgi:hypothetical protein
VQPVEITHSLPSGLIKSIGWGELGLRHQFYFVMTSIIYLSEETFAEAEGQLTK